VIQSPGPFAEDAEAHGVIRAAHQDLRARLDGLDGCLRRVAEGSGQAFVEARQQFEVLLVTFLRHLEQEESLLRPLLSHVRGWGPARLAWLEAEHTAQRLEIAELCALDPETTAGHWAARMRTFSSALRADMAHEERDFLTAL
jgi:iron-sulfur cluster repair protein YtfE (RIC family)